MFPFYLEFFDNTVITQAAVGSPWQLFPFFGLSNPAVLLNFVERA
nr:MAG TPA: hypothetical protein [Caudoviricetes sp.]